MTKYLVRFLRNLVTLCTSSALVSVTAALFNPSTKLEVIAHLKLRTKILYLASLEEFILRLVTLEFIIHKKYLLGISFGIPMRDTECIIISLVKNCNYSN